MVLLPEEGKAVVVLTNSSAMFGSTTSHLIANGIAALLAGKKPGKRGLSLKWFLTGLGFVMVLLTFGLLKEALAIKRWRMSLGEKLQEGGRKRTLAWASAFWGVLLPVALFSGLPVLLRLSWPQMLRAVPDLSWWMLFYLPAALVLGVVKARIFLGVWKLGRRPETR